MGVCMGKDSGLGELETDGRFVPQYGGNIPNDPERLPSTENSSNSQIVRFSEPRVPVIFILGGPGSGKITHCDRAVQERHGLAHVNMTDLIQQHIVGNGLEDFNQMSADNLVQVLMMEMKMAVNASAYLISGYPRSMRDVVEYTDKMRRVDKVILLNWHVKILEKQIEFGAQLGDTVLQLARMELKNYSKNVLAVADYFDQMKKLVVVDGERQPTEVYADFLMAIDSVVSAKPKKVQNGILPSSKDKKNSHLPLTHKQITTQQLDNKLLPMNLATPHSQKQVIWVIGGPGSNKSLLASNPKYPWIHLSLGSELRNIGESKHSLSPDQLAGIKLSLQRGELVSNDLIMRIITPYLMRHSYLVIDGFPRNYEQIKMFEEQSGLKPPCILVDCSEVELGRSLGQRGEERGDNEANSVKNRLTTYRIITLPTLKMLDDQQRLHIVDGDSDPSTVVAEFTQTISEVMIALEIGDESVKNKRKPSTDTIRAMYQEVEDE